MPGVKRAGVCEIKHEILALNHRSITKYHRNITEISQNHHRIITITTIITESRSLSTSKLIWSNPSLPPLSPLSHVPASNPSLTTPGDSDCSSEIRIQSQNFTFSPKTHFYVTVRYTQLSGILFLHSLPFCIHSLTFTKPLDLHSPSALYVKQEQHTPRKTCWNRKIKYSGSAKSCHCCQPKSLPPQPSGCLMLLVTLSMPPGSLPA